MVNLMKIGSYAEKDLLLLYDYYRQHLIVV